MCGCRSIRQLDGARRAVIGTKNQSRWDTECASTAGRNRASTTCSDLVGSTRNDYTGNCSSSSRGQAAFSEVIRAVRIEIHALIGSED